MDQPTRSADVNVPMLHHCHRIPVFSMPPSHVWKPQFGFVVSSAPNTKGGDSKTPHRATVSCHLTAFHKATKNIRSRAITCQSGTHDVNRLGRFLSLGFCGQIDLRQQLILSLWFKR